MKASEIKEAINVSILANRPMWIWGPPGCGKTKMVSDYALENGYEFVDIRTVLMDPVDAKGLPMPDGDRVKYLLPSFIPKTDRAIMFFDELPQAAPMVQAALLQGFQERTFCDIPLSPQHRLIAAGNRVEDKAGARRIITPLLNRFMHVDFDIDTNDWIGWATDNAIDPNVVSYIRFKPMHLMTFDAKQEQRAFASPRSWEYVSQILPHAPDHLMFKLVAGIVGEGVAAEFVSFHKTATALPPIGTLLANAGNVTLPTEPSILHALVGQLIAELRNADPPTTNQIGTLAARLPLEFATYAVIEGTRAVPTFRAAKPVAAWVTKNAKFLIS